MEQHKEFEDDLHRFEDYCGDENEEEFDGEKFRGLVDRFASAFQRHLTQEPATFYKLRHLDNAQVERVYEAQVKIAMQKADVWL